MTASEDLRALRPEVAFKAVRQRTVDDLGEDPTTVVVTDGDTTQTIPCLSSYPVRAVGDQVLIAQLDGGGWLVLGKMAASEADVTPSFDDVDAAIDDAIADIPVITATVSSSLPSGSDWVEIDRVFSRDDGNGNRSLHLMPPVGTTPNPPTVKAPKAPKPVTVSSSDQGGWRSSGSQSSDMVQAGAWTGSNWYGAWFFGDDITDACSGRTVSKIEVTISRRDDGSGKGQGVPVHFGLHDRTRRGRPSINSRWTPGARLAPGGKKTYALPSDQRDKLASGDQKGIAVYGSGRADYAHYSDKCSVKIYFAS